MTGPALLALFDAPWLPVFLIVIFWMSPALGWFSLVGALVLLVLAVVNERVSKPQLDEAQKYSMLAHAKLTDHLRNAEVIEAMGMLPQIRRRWYQLHRQQLALQARASDQAAVLGGATKFVRIEHAVAGAGHGSAAGAGRKHDRRHDDRRVHPRRPCAGAGRAGGQQLAADRLRQSGLSAAA